MKKALLFIILISSYSFGQFKITPEGYRSLSDESKDFYVKEFSGKTKQELFVDIKKFVSGKYKGLKNDGYNETPDEQIVLDLAQDTEYNGGFIQNRFEINFKDGKIMIKPTYNYIINSEGKKIFLTGGNFMAVSAFKKDGSIRTKFLKDLIENSVNNFSQKLINSIGKSEEW